MRLVYTYGELIKPHFKARGYEISFPFYYWWRRMLIVSVRMDVWKDSPLDRWLMQKVES